MIPAVKSLGRRKLLVLQRRTVNRSRSFERTSVTYSGLTDYYRGTFALSLALTDGSVQRGKVVSVLDYFHVPVHSVESFRNVLAERRILIAFYRYIVLIVNKNKLPELQRSRKTHCLVGYSLHKAAFAAKRVRIMVEYLITLSVERRRKHGFGYRHSDGVGYSLPQRPRGYVYALRYSVFRMTGSPASELSEPLHILDRYPVSE